MKKMTIIIIFILFQAKNSFAVFGIGDIIFDDKAATNAAIQISNLKKMVEQNVEMAKQIGDGKITPQTINWMNNWYVKCGGKKFVLPDWFPKPKLEVCAGSVKAYEASVKFYREKYMILEEDKKNPSIVAKKMKNREKDAPKIQAHILAKSVEQLERAEEDEKAIDQMKIGLSISSNLIETEKLKTQAMINILAEIQKTNESLAELKQGMFFN